MGEGETPKAAKGEDRLAWSMQQYVHDTAVDTVDFATRSF
jgi:hypothetical protein